MKMRVHTFTSKILIVSWMKAFLKFQYRLTAMHLSLYVICQWKRNIVCRQIFPTLSPVVPIIYFRGLNFQS